MKGLHYTAFILLVIGGLNWGLVGLGGFMGANWNVVNRILGSWPSLEWLVYILVGLSAIIIAVGHKKDCRTCGPSGAPTV
jgi:uncharacterized membrane protein YuzA (DUF378 family)